MATTNPIRFSTKYQDEETGLLYYGYRYYDASTGRWVSRDAIGEKGGLHLFCSAGNNLINRFDLFGLCCGMPNLVDGFEAEPPVISEPLPGHPTPAESAGYHCDRLRQEQKTKPPEPKPSRKCYINCENEVDRLMKEDSDVQKLLGQFKGKCKRPVVKCARSCKNGQGGGTNTKSRNITICPDENGNYKERVLHELTHSRQLCNKPNFEDCLTNLEMEMEAYYCSSPAQNRTFNELLGQAMVSSCGLGGFCRGDQVRDNYEKLQDWYNKKKENFCTGGGPRFPSVWTR